MTTLNFISKLQDIIIRFQMWRAAFLLRKDYNNPSMQEFTVLDADKFLDYS
ncbi:MAG: hypothetical protein Q7T89_07860 [Anaerolineales bacterium]|nr:hypothetical protein [Anaerolineales bacterium]